MNREITIFQNTAKVECLVECFIQCILGKCEKPSRILKIFWIFGLDNLKEILDNLKEIQEKNSNSPMYFKIIFKNQN